jgi:hypothetical protein
MHPTKTRHPPIQKRQQLTSIIPTLRIRTFYQLHTTILITGHHPTNPTVPNPPRQTSRIILNTHITHTQRIGPRRTTAATGSHASHRVAVLARHGFVILGNETWEAAGVTTWGAADVTCFCGVKFADVLAAFRLEIFVERHGWVRERVDCYLIEGVPLVGSKREGALVERESWVLST